MDQKLRTSSSLELRYRHKQNLFQPLQVPTVVFSSSLKMKNNNKIIMDYKLVLTQKFEHHGNEQVYCLCLVEVKKSMMKNWVEN